MTADANEKRTPRSIFLAVRQVATPAEQSQMLDEMCAGHEELQRRVKEMLVAAQSEQTNPLERLGAVLNTPEWKNDSPQPDIEKHPLIGPYKLHQRLGEGGMGVVFLAEQRKPLQRTVALKLIKRGMDSREVLARFEAERQAISLMNHPYIARVFDAGESDDGRPYFVMELVRGIPITDYCDQHKLATRERLELLIKVCQAVQHAHQKGIIHRDLKPSNILVELHDVCHVPKVIDFGVAKATHQRLTEHTLLTRFSQMIGTPLYMSPEQAELNGLDVDTRSDVYSLGVLLYELLTGTTPFDREALRQASFDEIRRIIREEEPPRPSHRISTLHAARLSTLSDRDPGATPMPQGKIEHELDWIAMKSLEKDRTRRYESASALAEDVQRYLDDEAVLACPPSPVYKLRKFARRNKGALFSGAVIVGSLCAGITVTSWQAFRAEAEKEKARTEAAIATAVNDFLQNDLLGMTKASSQLSAGILPDPDIKLRTVLDRAAEKIAGQFSDQPLVEAAIQQTIGTAYSSLGEYKLASPHLERSKQLRQQHLGTDHVETVKTELDLIFTYRGQGKSTASGLAELVKHCQEVFGSDAEVTLEAMQGHVDALISTRSPPADAESLARDVLERRQRILGGEHRDTLISMSSLSWAMHRMGHHADAETLSRDVLEIQKRTLGPDHPDTLVSMLRLGAIINYQGYFVEGHFVEAEKQLSELLAILRRVMGPEHPNTLATMNNLAVAISSQGREVEAEKIFREELDIRKRTQGLEHIVTLGALRNLAVNLSFQGRHTEAEQLFRELLAIERRLFGPESSGTIPSQISVALSLKELGRVDEATQLFRETLQLPAADADQLMTVHRHLGDLLSSQGRWDEAAQAYRQLLDLAIGPVREQRPSVADAWISVLYHDLVSTLRQGSQSELVEPLLREGLATWRQLEGVRDDKGSCHAPLFALHHQLALWLQSTARDNEAREHFIHAKEMFERLAVDEKRLLIAIKDYLRSHYGSLPAIRAETSGDELALRERVAFQLPAALASARQNVQDRPGETWKWNTWNWIALAHYRERNWEGAEVEARLAVQLGADGPNRMMHIVPLFLLAGRHDEYRAVCERLMDGWERWTGDALGSATNMCLLDPYPPSDSERLLRLALRAADKEPALYRQYPVQAHFRMGDPEKWIELAVGEGDGPTDAGPTAQLLLAIAYQHAGRHEDARAWLASAHRSVNTWTSVSANLRMEMEVLRHEAERLILSERDMHLGEDTDQIGGDGT